MYTLKDELKGNVHFSHFRNGELFYTTDSGFTFAVPTNDTGTGSFFPHDRAMLFMRWLRPALIEWNALVDSQMTFSCQE